MQLSLEEIRETILELAGEHVEFIALFGSRARGTEHDSSDTDIAVKTNIEDSIERGRLGMHLVSALNGPELRTDLVTIEDADWHLKYRIARDGKVLLNRDYSWERFVEMVIKYYPDYLIFFSKIQDESLRRRVGLQETDV